MSSSDDDFEGDCVSCESSDESDEGEIEFIGDANGDEHDEQQHRLLVVRGREPYMFEPMARQQNMEVDDDDIDVDRLAPINYDERMGNTNW
jgi:hypothetical protein